MGQKNLDGFFSFTQTDVFVNFEKSHWGIYLISLPKQLIKIRPRWFRKLLDFLKTENAKHFQLFEKSHWGDYLCQN